jgi:hypothetical protein
MTAVLVVGDLRDDRFGFQFTVISARADLGVDEREARARVQASIAAANSHIGRMLAREVAFTLLVGSVRGDRSKVPLLEAPRYRRDTCGCSSWSRHAFCAGRSRRRRRPDAQSIE